MVTPGRTRPPGALFRLGKAICAPQRREQAGPGPGDELGREAEGGDAAEHPAPDVALDRVQREREAAEFFEERIARRIFPEMLELTARLREAGCELWAISSTRTGFRLKI